MTPSHALSLTPDTPSHIDVQLMGAPSGHLDVVGTSEGASASERLEWSGRSATRMTARRFEHIDRIDTSVTSSTSMLVRLSGGGGGPQGQLAVVRGPNHLVEIDQPEQSHWKSDVSGHRPKADAVIYVPYETTWEPKVDDEVDVLGGPTYRIVSSEVVPDRLTPEKWECRAVRLT